MGSYTAPVQTWAYFKGIVDVTTPSGALAFGLSRLGNFLCVVKTSPGFNGDIRAELEREGGAFAGIGAFNVASRCFISVPDFYLAADDMKYPWQFRVRVASAPTIGSALVYVVELPPPANPLF